MPTIALGFGLALIGLGITAYLEPGLLGEGKQYQPTALSPAAVGVVLALCGLVSLVLPKARKHAMHAAAMFGLLGSLGGFVPVILRKFDFGQTAVIVGLGMAVLSGVFLALCVNSFIQARKARKAAAGSA